MVNKFPVLEEVLKMLKDGEIQIDDAIRHIGQIPFHAKEVDGATLDYHRKFRHGLTEVVYGESKTIEQILSISEALSSQNQTVLITRLDDAKRTKLREKFKNHRENEKARTFLINPPKVVSPESTFSFVAILAAGTSDIPVAEEAAEVCIALEVPFKKIFDVGVAGLQRILARLEDLQKASVLIVCAGMEGALPSVVGGLVGKPLIAVPTSVGYGASFGGLTALLAMMNSCAPGVSVVNIDNGFSAGFAACQTYREIIRHQNGGEK